MNIQTHIIRSGFDGRRCLVHARCCQGPDRLIATAQHLDIQGCDLFTGICMSTSTDGGRSWSDFSPQEGLAPISEGQTTLVGCDGTPMYHHKSGKFLLLGHTAQYAQGASAPTGFGRRTFYSVFDSQRNCFSPMKFIAAPETFGGKYGCGNGCGQSIELENGNLLIPVYYKNTDGFYASAVMKCDFDGECITFQEMGNSLSMSIGRGLYEPSIIYHKGIYYMTLRNDECGAVARSTDGLHYDSLQLWKWDDGSLLDTYNTQQHWMILEDELYLIYTRRGAGNDRVFRHRAPLFVAQVNDMHLVRSSEISFLPERGARLGNFGVTQVSDAKALVMAAEWMQPAGCQKYGSDNAVFFSQISSAD